MQRRAFDSGICFIFSPAHFFQLYLFYAEVTELQLLKSSLLSFHPPLPSTPSAAAKGRFFDKSAPKSLHFYSYKYRFRAPRSPSDTKPEWPLTDSFLLFIYTLTKFTSTPLIDPNHQHSTRGRCQGAWQWICSMNIVEKDLITL